MGYYAQHIDGELRFKNPAVIRANWQSYTQHLRALYNSSPNAAELVPDDVSEMSDAEILELLTARMSLHTLDINDPQCVVPSPDMERASSSFHIYGVIVDSSCAALLFEPGGEIMFNGEDGDDFGVRITETGYVLTRGKVHWLPIRPLRAIPTRGSTVSHPASSEMRPTERVAAAVDLAMAVARDPNVGELARLRALVAAHRWDVEGGDGDVSSALDERVFGQYSEFFALFGVSGWNAGDVTYDEGNYEFTATPEYMDELRAGAAASRLDPLAPPSTWG